MVEAGTSVPEIFPPVSKPLPSHLVAQTASETAQESLVFKPWSTGFGSAERETLQDLTVMPGSPTLLVQSAVAVLCDVSSVTVSEACFNPGVL